MKRILYESEAHRCFAQALANSLGERFMTRYSREWMELATRDVVSRSIWNEVKEGRGSPHGGVFLDISHQSREFLQGHFPTIMSRCQEFGIDIANEPIPVVPATPTRRAPRWMR